VGAGYEQLCRYSGGCIYVKEEIETKGDNKTKQDKGVEARDEGNLIQQATDTWLYAWLYVWRMDWFAKIYSGGWTGLLEIRRPLS
jgi:hypothetical protein